MNTLIETHSMQKEKSKFRRKVSISKKVYRYPKKIYFLTDDDIFCHCTQINQAFLRKRIMKNYLRRLKNTGYLSPQGYTVLKKHHYWQEGGTVYIAGKLKLPKQDIEKLFHLPLCNTD